MGKFGYYAKNTVKLYVISTFSIGHCVVCSSSIYRFRLPFWYLQTLLPTDQPYFERPNVTYPTDDGFIKLTGFCQAQIYQMLFKSDGLVGEQTIEGFKMQILILLRSNFYSTTTTSAMLAITFTLAFEYYMKSSVVFQ